MEILFSYPISPHDYSSLLSCASEYRGASPPSPIVLVVSRMCIEYNSL